MTFRLDRAVVVVVVLAPFFLLVVGDGVSPEVPLDRRRFFRPDRNIMPRADTEAVGNPLLELVAVEGCGSSSSSSSRLFRFRVEVLVMLNTYCSNGMNE